MPFRPSRLSPGPAILRVGDVLAEIDGQEVLAKDTARLLLWKAAGDERSVVVRFRRRGHERVVVLDPGVPAAYPYRPSLGHSFGVCLAEAFRPRYVRSISDAIARHGAKRVLIVVSPLMRPQFREAVRVTPPQFRWPADVQARIVLSRDHFWGGNIVLDDLATVGDYVRVIRRALRQGPADLVLLPDSAFRNGRDHLGEPWVSVARQTGVEVDLVPTVRIMS